MHGCRGTDFFNFWLCSMVIFKVLIGVKGARTLGDERGGHLKSNVFSGLLFTLWGMDRGQMYW